MRFTSSRVVPRASALYGPGGSIPTYNLAWGLRTVDGTYNNLLPGQEHWGAADNEFPELLRTSSGRSWSTPMALAARLVPVTYPPGVDNDGPGLPTRAMSSTPTSARSAT